jgi:hypothetical protein
MEDSYFLRLAREKIELLECHVADLERDLADCQIERDALEGMGTYVHALKCHLSLVASVSLWYLNNHIESLEFMDRPTERERRMVEDIINECDRLKVPLADADTENDQEGEE